MRRAPFVIAGALALVACNLISGLSEDFRLASATLDGGDDAPLAPPPPPPRDDGSAVPDAASDAPPDAPPFAGAFCTDAGALAPDSGVVFCWDFEEDASAPKWGWTKTDVANGSVAVEDDAGFMGTRALHATAADAGAGVTSRKAALVQVMTTSLYAHYELTFKVRVKHTDLSYVALGILGFNVDMYDQYYGVAEHNATQLDVTAHAPAVPDGVGFDEMPPTQWRDVRVVLDRADGGTTYSGQLFVDGSLYDSTNGVTSMNQLAEIRVGAFFTSKEVGTAEVYVDDVVVRAR